MHSRSRAAIASFNADWATVTAGVTRAARAVATSVMLTEAKPMPAVTAKTKVIAHTAHPAIEVARWRVCQSPAAHDGMTRAARSAATPMAKKSHPAMSLDPSDRANQPFVVTPTAASATRRSARSSSSRATPRGAPPRRGASAASRRSCRCAARSSTSRRHAKTRSSPQSRSVTSSPRSGPVSARSLISVNSDITMY